MKHDINTLRLFQSAFEGNLEAVTNLVRQGANVNAMDEITKCAPIHLATHTGKIEVIKFLIENKADINAPDKTSGSTPLHIVSGGGGFLLFTSELFANQRDGTELIAKEILSAQKYHPLVAKFLLEKGADTEAKDKNGMTPLLIAAQSGNVPMIKLLVKKGANIDALANNTTPLYFAIENGHTEAATTLIELGAKIDKIDNLGRTPLHIAIENNKTKTALALIKLGANVNLPDGTFNFTPLQIAAQKGNTELLKPLIDKGADVNAEDEMGNTPYLLASKNGNSETAKALIKLGAKDLKDLTPLEIIAIDGRAEALRSLKIQESKKNNVDSKGNIPQSNTNLRGGEGGKGKKLDALSKDKSRK